MGFFKQMFRDCTDSAGYSTYMPLESGKKASFWRTTDFKIHPVFAESIFKIKSKHWSVKLRAREEDI